MNSKKTPKPAKKLGVKKTAIKDLPTRKGGDVKGGATGGGCIKQ